MKSEVLDINAFGFELVDKFFSHVKAGGRRSGGTKLFGPNSLIAFDVIWVSIATKVRRKWNGTVLLDNVCEWSR